MSDAATTFRLNGLLSRRTVALAEPLVEGRRYRVWLRIGELAQGSVCVWVGGNRTAFFTTAGEHVDEVEAGETQEVTVQGLNAVAAIAGVAVKAVAGAAEID
jgi:hypothetical protein